ERRQLRVADRGERVVAFGHHVPTGLFEHLHPHRVVAPPVTDHRFRNLRRRRSRPPGTRHPARSSTCTRPPPPARARRSPPCRTTARAKRCPFAATRTTVSSRRRASHGRGHARTRGGCRTRRRCPPRSASRPTVAA